MSAAGGGGVGKVERLSSIDAQLRQLVPAKLSEDDKLIEYDALLLDRFLDVLHGLHGDDLKDLVIYPTHFLPFLFSFDCNLGLEQYYV